MSLRGIAQAIRSNPYWPGFYYNPNKRTKDILPRSARRNIIEEDLMQGKVWVVQDKTRRASKRQKDLADILRLIERKKSLLSLVPDSMKDKLLL